MLISVMKAIFPKNKAIRTDHPKANSPKKRKEASMFEICT